MNEPVIRKIVWLTDQAMFTPAELYQDLAEWTQPIHFAGAAIHIQNQGNNVLDFFVEDSPNGVVWSPVLVSTHSTSGNIFVTVVGRGQQGVFFTTHARYVRFRVFPACPEGVCCVVSQFPPRGREAGGYG